MYQVYIGVGSNQANPPLQLRQALAHLQTTPGVVRVQSSSWYRTRPQGLVLNQPDFLNAVWACHTTLGPFALLHVLQAIERTQGRVRDQCHGPRTLDLDLLLYADWQLQTRELTVPHPAWLERAFVLFPLAELQPALPIDIEICKQRLAHQGIERINS